MKAKNKKAPLLLAQAALIAAMYAVLTFAQQLILPGTASMAVQYRLSEALMVLCLFTPAAVPGLTLGCFAANFLFMSALPVDMIFGSLATLLAAVSMRLLCKVKVKGFPALSFLMPALFNGVIIGAEIEVFFIDGPFHLGSFLTQGGFVALGELAVMFTAGTALFFALKKLAGHLPYFDLK